jgi:hypothetical protein
MAMIHTRSKVFLAATGLGILLSFEPVWSTPPEPLLINQIAIDPKDSRNIYAAARPQGMLKSTDRGKTWHPARKGLTNTSAYHIVINPINPKILYISTFGGGVYKSENAGEDWFEVNEGLGNTNIHALALNPREPDQLLVSTSTGELFLTEDSGARWRPFNDGLPPFQGEIIANILIFPDAPGGYYLAQRELFQRSISSSDWQVVDGNLKDEVITAAAVAPTGRTIYAGTMTSGLYKTTANAGSPLLRRRLDWTPVDGPFRQQWVRWVVPDPSNPSVLYVGVAGQGFFQSRNGGASWRTPTEGLPDDEVTSLAVDPNEPKILYAGTAGHGIFRSTDGGQRWKPPVTLEAEPLEQVMASLSDRSLIGKASRIAPPPAFAKCNRCHGWTDPLLNQKATYWRVAPNIRDWRPTVHRMSHGADLTVEEEEQIVRFLTDYGTQRRPTP